MGNRYIWHHIKWWRTPAGQEALQRIRVQIVEEIANGTVPVVKVRMHGRPPLVPDVRQEGP